MIRNVFNLSKIFVSSFRENLDMVYNKDKKHKLSWFAVLFVFLIMYISYFVIRELKKIGLQYIFLEGYFLVVSFFTVFQVIMSFSNVFYFADDLEFILPFPVKKHELLISKFIALLCIVYAFEMLLGLIPIIMFGLMISTSVAFYIYALLFLMLNPICLTAIIGAFMMIVMRVFRFVKNKDFFQLFTTFLLIFVVIIAETFVFKVNFSDTEALQQEIQSASDLSNKLAEVNRYFIVINPAVKALNNTTKWTSIFEVLTVFLIDVISVITFLFVGTKIYFEDVLRYLSNGSLKNSKTAYRIKRLKGRGKAKAYIFREFGDIFKNPMFFMQCVYPVVIALIIIGIVLCNFAPMIRSGIHDEEFIKEFGELKPNIEFICFILAGMQVLYSLSNISITMFSREGKSANFVKYIPIRLHSQFVYKNVPQIFLNFIVSVLVMFFVNYAVGFFGTLEVIEILGIAFLLNVINSYLMGIVDLKRPNLDWDAEYTVVKQNKNKIFQYLLTIGICMLLLYLQNVLENINLNLAVLILFVIFGLGVFGVDYFVRKNERKLFNKIV